MRFSITSRKLPLFLNRFLTILLIGLFCSNVLGQVPQTNIVENPEEFVWTFQSSPEPHWTGVMEVGEASFTIDGETFTTRAYRQEGTDYSVPGPTINVVPGNKYILSLHNTLPFEVLSTSHNVFKDPNAVNIHTHGLHISGESPADDVTRVFEGGKERIHDVIKFWNSAICGVFHHSQN